MKVWQVSVGVLDYLPDDWQWFRTKQEAIEYAKFLKEDWLDYVSQSDEPSYRVRGDIRRQGCYSVQRWDGKGWDAWVYITLEPILVAKEAWQQYQKDEGLDVKEYDNGC